MTPWLLARIPFVRGSLQVRLCRHSALPLAPGRRLHGLPPPKDEYDSVAQYPEIPQFATEREANEHDLCKTVNSLKTVEERQYYANKPKYYGWYTAIARVDKIPYGALDLFKSATWTHVVDGLPEDRYGGDVGVGDALCDRLAEELSQRLAGVEAVQCKTQVGNDLVVGVNHKAMPKPMENFTSRRMRAKRMVIEANRLLMTRLVSAADGHLFKSQVDVNSRNEAFWFRGGFHPDRKAVLKKLGHQKIQKEFAKDPGMSFRRGGKNVHQQHVVPMTEEEVWKKHDRAIQILNENLLQLRSSKMIKPFADKDADVVRQGASIPDVPYEPRQLGVAHKFRHGTNSPGFWPSSDNGFVHLQFVDSSVNRAVRETSNSAWTEEEAERENMLVSKAILASFGQCLAQATHLGYGPFQDPARPIAVQTVLTDGEKFKFCVFQLNRTALFSQPDADSVTNVLWHTEEKPLLRTSEEDGQLHVDRDVVRNLVRFYLQEPSVEMDSDAGLLEDVENTYNREYFFHQFRAMYSNRPRATPRPFIEAWQKIRILDHNLDFAKGVMRERPWFMMAKYDWKGREHWHPEYKHYDYFESAYQPKKFRMRKGQRRVKKVVAPIPDEAEEFVEKSG